MNDINSITVSGRITRDTELKTTNNAKIFAKFTLAINQGKYVNEAWVPNTIFVDCTAWDKRAESAQKHLLKGVFCVVTGKIRQEEWENSEGKKQRKLSIQVEQFTAVKKDAQQTLANNDVSQESDPADSDIAAYFSGQDEEMPF